MDERRLLEDGDLRADAVRELGDERHADGEQDVGPAANDLEIREGEEVLDVVHREPVLLGPRVLEAEELRGAERGLPDEVVIRHDHAAAGGEQRREAIEGALDVVEVADDVGEEDRVERALGERVVLDVGDVELDAGVALLGELDHARRDVDAHAARAREARDEVAEAAAHLEDARAWHDERADEAAQLLLVVPTRDDLLGAQLRELVVPLDALLEPFGFARGERATE